MMRSQIEQLQSRQQHLQRYADRLKLVLEAIDHNGGNFSRSSGSGSISFDFDDSEHPHSEQTRQGFASNTGT